MTGISRLLSKELGVLRYAAPQLVASYFDQFSNYFQMLADAKRKARRSVLIDHCGVEHIDLKSNFYNIERVYSIERETKRGPNKLSLIEFQSEHDAEVISKQARHNEGLLPVPMKILRYTGPSANPSPDRQDLSFLMESVRLSYRGELFPSSTSYTDLLSSNMMSLVNFKIRIITLVNLEHILCSGLFGAYELIPFGSSVIDLGCDSGDLDIVVTRKYEDHRQFLPDYLKKDNANSNSNRTVETPSSLSSKLVHLDKSLYSEIKDNSGPRGTMRWFDHILKEYMPLTDGYGVLFLRYAKVPIIKFKSRITGIDCDLSFNLGLDQRESNESRFSNASGIVMGQILYSLCRNNSLFTAVAIYLRIFGKLTSITSKEPNVGLTNFQYLSLIIFYLQQVSIVPSQDAQDSTDLRLEVRCKKLGRMYQQEHQQLPERIVPPFRDILRDSFVPRRVSLSPNQIEQLLPEAIEGFLKFYSDFDFRVNTLDLYESKLDRKLDNSALSITNPLDRSKNICHNVSRKGLEDFVKQVRLNSRRLKDPKQDPLTLINSFLSKHQQ